MEITIESFILKVLELRNRILQLAGVNTGVFIITSGFYFAKTQKTMVTTLELTLYLISNAPLSSA